MQSTKKKNICLHLLTKDTNNRDGDLYRGAGMKDGSNKILWFRRRDLTNLLCISSVSFNPFDLNLSGSSRPSHPPRCPRQPKPMGETQSCTNLPQFSIWFPFQVVNKEGGKSGGDRASEHPTAPAPVSTGTWRAARPRRRASRRARDGTRGRRGSSGRRSHLWTGAQRSTSKLSCSKAVLGHTSFNLSFSHDWL